MGCIFNCCKKNQKIIEDEEDHLGYPSLIDQEIKLTVSEDNNMKFKGYQNMEKLKKFLNTILKDTNTKLWHQFEKQLNQYKQEIKKYQVILEIDQNKEENLKQLSCEIQKGYILLENRANYIDVKIQININLPTHQTKLPTFTTKCQNTKDILFNWDEFFDIQLPQEAFIQPNSKINFINEQGSFSVRMQAYDQVKKKQIQIGREQTYSFFELIDQQIHAKVISFIGSEGVYAKILIRVQLIKEFKQFLNWTNIDINAKLDSIIYICNYITQNPEDKKEKNWGNISNLQQFNSNISYAPSLIQYDEKNSMQSVDSFYNIPFKVK